MTESSTGCPTHEQLKALVDGTLSAHDHFVMQSHVDGCTACQNTLESLVAGGESWDAALNHLKHEAPATEEAKLADAIQRMKADPFVETASTASRSTDPLDFLSPSDTPGSIGRLGVYEVTEVIGQGGMGIVLKAFDPALHRVVAVKVLAPYLANNPQARKRFVREAQAVAAVSHDHVITIHAIDPSTEQPKIVMQYIPGRSLQQKLDAEGSLELKEILRIGMQTASGLAAAHAQGLVHRDIKPSNILLENSIQRVKLTDFGLARAVDDASLTQSGVIAGTPQYMAPEQANGDAVDFRADLFSLGSVLYAMCVGHSPFRASTTMGVLKRVCHDPPRPIRDLNPDIPEWLCAIVMKLLSKNPEDRFPSAKAVADLLERWLAHLQQPQVAPKPQPSSDIPETGRKRKWIGMSSMSRPNWLPARFAWPLTPEVFAVSVALFIALVDDVSLVEVIIIGACTWLATKVFYSWRGVHPSLVTPTSAMAEGQINGLDAQVESPSSEDGKSKTGLAGFPWWILICLLVGLAIVDNIFPRMAEKEFQILVVLGTAAFLFLVLLRYLWPGSPTDSGASPNVVGLDAPTEPPPVPTSFASLVSLWAKEMLRWTYNIPEKMPIAVREMLARSVGPSLWISWYLVGAIDLLLTLFFMFGSQFSVWTLVVWLCMSGSSFVVSHCIYVRQNLAVVRRLAYVGLLPITWGAIVRIPLSIVTLLWQGSAATRDSFEQTPWTETRLGWLVNTYVSPHLRK